jgi:DNA-binding transcriptional ArsR family regulator
LSSEPSSAHGAIHGTPTASSYPALLALTIGCVKGGEAITCDIDRLLHALADPTRRRIVERLGGGTASVTVLAEPLPMSLPAVLQHLQVLESCGLVASEKIGRARTCRLELQRLNSVQTWIDARQRTWERRLDRLGRVLADTSPLSPDSEETTS